MGGALQALGQGGQQGIGPPTAEGVYPPAVNQQGGLGGGGMQSLLGGQGMEGMLQDPRMLFALSLLKNSQGAPGAGAPGFGQVLGGAGLDTVGMLQQAAQQKSRNKMLEQMMSLRTQAEERASKAEERAVKESGMRLDLMGKQAALDEKRFGLASKQETFREKLLAEQTKRQEEESKANIEYKGAATKKLQRPEQMTPFQAESARLEREKMEENTRRYNEEGMKTQAALEKQQAAQQGLIEQVNKMSLPDSIKEAYTTRIQSGVKDPLKDLQKYSATAGATNPNTEALDMIEAEIKESRSMFGVSKMDPTRAMESLTSLARIAQQAKTEPERLRVGVLAKKLLDTIPPEMRQKMIQGESPLNPQTQAPQGTPMGGQVNPNPYGP